MAKLHNNLAVRLKKKEPKTKKRQNLKGQRAKHREEKLAAAALAQAEGKEQQDGQPQPQPTMPQDADMDDDDDHDANYMPEYQTNILAKMTAKTVKWTQAADHDDGVNTATHQAQETTEDEIKVLRAGFREMRTEVQYLKKQNRRLISAFSALVTLTAGMSRNSEDRTLAAEFSKTLKAIHSFSK